MKSGAHLNGKIRQPTSLPWTYIWVAMSIVCDHFVLHNNANITIRNPKHTGNASSRTANLMEQFLVAPQISCYSSLPLLQNVNPTFQPCPMIFYVPGGKGTIFKTSSTVTLLYFPRDLTTTSMGQGGFVWNNYPCL